MTEIDNIYFEICNECKTSCHTHNKKPGQYFYVSSDKISTQFLVRVHIVYLSLFLNFYYFHFNSIFFFWFFNSNFFSFSFSRFYNILCSYNPIFLSIPFSFLSNLLFDCYSKISYNQYLQNLTYNNSEFLTSKIPISYSIFIYNLI